MEFHSGSYLINILNKGIFFTEIIIFLFLGLHLWYMEVPRLGVELELQLPADTTATATPHPSCFCDLHCSLWQRQILNPLSRDGTHVLMDTSQAVLFFFFFLVFLSF